MIPFHETPFDHYHFKQNPLHIVKLFLFLFYMIFLSFPVFVLRILIIQLCNLIYIDIPIQNFILGIFKVHYNRPDNKPGITQIYLSDHHSTSDGASVEQKCIIAPKVYDSIVRKLLLPSQFCIRMEFNQENRIEDWLFSEANKGLHVWIAAAGFTTKQGIVASFHHKFFKSGDHETYVVRVETHHAFSWAPRSLGFQSDFLEWYIVQSLPYHFMKVHYYKIDTNQPNDPKEWTQEMVDRRIGKDIFEAIHGDTYITGWTAKKKQEFYKNYKSSKQTKNE